MPIRLGPFELIIVLVIVVIIFGVGRLPEIGGAVGKAIREFRQATSEPDEEEKKSEPSEEKTAG
jgi:sec-independent protein translocase protein TatA